MEKSWNFTNKFLILMNRRRYAATFHNPTDVYVNQEVMEFCDTVMEKSWNFVATISWQPCESVPRLMTHRISNKLWNFVWCRQSQQIRSWLSCYREKHSQRNVVLLQSHYTNCVAEMGEILSSYEHSNAEQRPLMLMILTLQIVFWFICNTLSHPVSYFDFFFASLRNNCFQWLNSSVGVKRESTILKIRHV